MADSTELPKRGCPAVEFAVDREPRPLETWLKRALIAIGAVFAIPYLLAIVYWFVPPPVSATMLWNALAGDKASTIAGGRSIGDLAAAGEGRGDFRGCPGLPASRGRLGGAQRTLRGGDQRRSGER